MATTAPAITGIGIASPLGVGTTTYWDTLLNADHHLHPITSFDTTNYPVTLAGQVPHDATTSIVKKRLLPQTDHVTRLALVASEEALDDAPLDRTSLDPYDIGVSVSSSSGGLEFGQAQLQKLWSNGWEDVSPYMSFAWYYAVNTGQVSIRHGLKGPGSVPVSEQAGGADAVAYATRRLHRGAPAMLAGGVDGLLCPYGMAALSKDEGANRTKNPNTYAPFSLSSCGYFPGEGGALMVLQDAPEQCDRYALIAASASTFDATERGGTGSGLFRCASTAITKAGLNPKDIDVVFADAHGTHRLDDAEARTLTDLFTQSVPVTAPKRLYGRLMSGGSALDIATAALSLKTQIIPPTGTSPTDAPDPRINLISLPTPCTINSALVLSRGFGGYCAATVLTR